METIIRKLKITKRSRAKYYLIEEIKYGLRNSLKQQIIIKNKFLYLQLQILNKEINEIPSPTWYGIDDKNQIKAIKIASLAYILINKHLNATNQQLH